MDTGWLSQLKPRRRGCPPAESRINKTKFKEQRQSKARVRPRDEQTTTGGLRLGGGKDLHIPQSGVA